MLNNEQKLTLEFLVKISKDSPCGEFHEGPLEWPIEIVENKEENIKALEIHGYIIKKTKSSVDCGASLSITDRGIDYIAELVNQ